MPSRDLPIRALQAFAVIYECGGIRAAARELGIAHSSLSRHLHELTRWLGVRLILEARGRARLQFTPQGEALGQATLAALRTLERASLSIREAKYSRSVTIETTPSFAARWLLPRLATFEAAHRGIEISVVADQKVNDPDGTNVDLALRMGPGPWSGVACEPLMRDALYPVMTPQLWRQCARPDRTRDLARLRLLHDRDPTSSWELWRSAMGPPTLDVRKGPRFTSSDLVLRAAAQGQGVALAHDRLVREDIRAGVLMRPLGSAQLDLGIAHWIVLPAQRRPRPAVSTVATWLKKLVETEDGRDERTGHPDVS
jgi:LysR family glycine cleavage system transcriptional activator